MGGWILFIFSAKCSTIYTYDTYVLIKAWPNFSAYSSFTLAKHKFKFTDRLPIEHVWMYTLPAFDLVNTRDCQ